MVSRVPRPLAVSLGDPAGVGPDIVMAAWQVRKERDISPFFVIGDPDVLEARALRLGIDTPLRACSPQDALDVFDAALPVIPLPSGVAVKPGKPAPATAPSTIEAIRRAVETVQTGEASAVVTCPIAKSVLYASGFTFPGHTEYLAALAAPNGETPPLPVMMIAGPELKTVPVTIHIPLSEVPTRLTGDLIATACRIVDRDMRARFGLSSPRIAIAGLNPHAGENGALGTEDDAVIRPTVKLLASEGLNVTGPLPADTMFHKSARETYDVAVCMYHDQALIPAKALGFDDAVNVTLGLPFIRTSPDHGTAFAIAGTGKARPDSMIAALKMAADMAKKAEAANNERI